MGNKALDGVKAGGIAINKEIDKSLEEKKRKDAIYKEEYEKTLKEEKGKLQTEQDLELRKKARKDAKKRIRGHSR